MGNEHNIHFWLDVWLTKDRLSNQFPTLFLLEKVKSCVVADCCNVNDGVYMIMWNWKSQLVSDIAVTEFMELLKLLYYFRLTVTP